MHIMYFGHFLSHRISLFCPVLPLTASFFQIVGVSFLGMQLSTPHRQLHTASLLPINPSTLILVLPSFPHQEPTTSTAVVSTPLLKCIPPLHLYFHTGSWSPPPSSGPWLSSYCTICLSASVLVTFLLMCRDTVTKAIYKRKQLFWGSQFQRI